MEYNDYPEKLDDQVVEQLNYNYNDVKADVQNVSGVFEGISESVKELRVNDMLLTVINNYDHVLHCLKFIRKSDRRNGNKLDGFIDATIKQRNIVGECVNKSSVLAVDDYRKSANFHKCCVEYSLAELDLIDSLLKICKLHDVHVNTECFYEFVLLRLNIYRKVFVNYTL